jgi:hypothetical protein
VSSLQAVTSINFNPTFPKLGLCYRMNCYKEDYLQIAVVDPFVRKLFWYKCPSEGGKIYIPRSVCDDLCLWLPAYPCCENVCVCTASLARSTAP